MESPSPTPASPVPSPDALPGAAERPSRPAAAHPGAASPGLDPIQVVQVLARALTEAVAEGDTARAADLVVHLAGADLPVPRSTDERRLQAMALELAARVLGEVLLTEEEPSGAWRRFLLPCDDGLFETSALARLAGELRRLGSALPSVAGTDHLDPAALAPHDLKTQALALGRFLVTHDAGDPGVDAPLDLPGLWQALDPRLHPVLEEWVLCTYAVSPLALAGEDVDARQRAAVTAVTDRDRARAGRSACGSGQTGALYDLAYRTDAPLVDVARSINGQRMRGLFERFGPRAGEFVPTRPDLDRLASREVLVLAPNWHPAHVVHRCLGPLVDGLLDDGLDAEVLRLRHAGDGPARPVPAPWAGRCRDALVDERFALSDLDAIARTLAAGAPDLVLHPEVTPNHASGWLATRRIGRVQAALYGMPVTTGMGAVDAAICGVDVEPPDADAHYDEELVLVPGLGVACTAPPAPTTPRVRPVDDHRVRLVSISSRHKLGRGLLRAWDAIQDGPARTDLTLFANLGLGEVERWTPHLAELLTHGDVDLRTSTPRQALVDELQDADIYLDAFPFGGFNTLVEVLCAGVPVVTLEGRAARGRFGAAMLRRLGLPGFLIAKDASSYVEAARRLCDDPGLRADVRARIGGPARVLAALNDPDAGAHFAAAVRFLRERGPRRVGAPRRSPVLVAAGERPRRLAS